jgi:hypothetical protein
MVAQMLKRTEKWTWRPESVVRVASCGGVAGGATVGVSRGCVTCGIEDVLLPFSLNVSIRMLAGFILSVDTVTGLPCTRSSSVFLSSVGPRGT